MVDEARLAKATLERLNGGGRGCIESHELRLRGLTCYCTPDTCPQAQRPWVLWKQLYAGAAMQGRKAGFP